MLETELDNPYWDAVRGHIHRDPLDGTVVGGFDECGNFYYGLERQELVTVYSWTIPDPDSVEFVVAHAGPKVVDPMAGTGYWAYILGQRGVDVVCYDLRPGSNPWHSGSPLHVEIEVADGAEAVARHNDRTLLLAWPPYSTDDGARVVDAYRGSRVIYMGEGEGGCTGDARLHDALQHHWMEVDYHRPVQWFGLHDYITVYERLEESP